MADQTETLGLRLHADGVVATSNGVKVTADAVQNLGAKADRASAPVAALGMSAKQTSQAMRQLPMQITDVVTSLSSGMPVWMVAIQQGGQIRDSFGGIGPAMRAMVSYVGPVGLALGGVAAVAGVLAAAFTQGESEALGYSQAIVMTGNAAGVTTDQVSDMARAVGETVGTQRQAADAMTQLLGSARVTGAQLSQFAEVAIRMERVTGQSVSKTVQTFADLAKDPVQAATKLNETTNFLTLEVYRQIKALQEQKRYSEAAALAQQTYADVVGGRLKELEGNLGTLEKAWRFVTQAAAKGWDALLGMGRKKTSAQEIAELQSQIESYEQEITDAYVRGDSARAAVLEKELTLRKEQQSVLQSDVRTSKSAAEGQAAEAAAVGDAIKADQDKTKVKREVISLYERFMTQSAERLAAERQELELGRQQTAAEAFRVSALKEIDAIRKKEGETKAEDARARVEEIAQLIEVNAWTRAAAESQQELEQKRAQSLQTARQGVQTLERERDALLDQISTIGASSEHLAMREVMLNNNAIAQREARLAIIETNPAYEAETAALREQIALLNEKSALTMRKFRATQENEERQANEKRTKDLAASIEEGIFNGFREGGKMADIFLRELKAQFARTVLRAPVQMLAQSGSDLLGMLFKVAGSVFGGGGGNMDPNYPTDNTGPRAWGGNVEPGGTYLVGERGPEILRMGRQRGSVEPNPVMGTGNGGGRVVHMTFAPQISIDSRSDRAQVMADVQRVVQAGQAQLLEMMERRQA